MNPQTEIQHSCRCGRFIPPEGGDYMLNKLIHFSLHNRAIVIGCSLLLLVLGLQTATRAARRGAAGPDQADRHHPHRIARASRRRRWRRSSPSRSKARCMGVARADRLRSNSDVALSLVFAEFGWGTDIYKARQLVQERLQGVREHAAGRRAAVHDAGRLADGRNPARRRAQQQGRRTSIAADGRAHARRLDDQRAPAEHPRHRRSPHHGRRREAGRRSSPIPYRMAGARRHLRGTGKRREGSRGQLHRRLHQHRPDGNHGAQSRA